MVLCSWLVLPVVVHCGWHEWRGLFCVSVDSLHSNSQLDINVKGQMIRDMMNLAGFRLPDKHDIIHSAHTSFSTADLRSVKGY